MSNDKVQLFADSVYITDLNVSNKDAADYLRTISEENREATIIRAIVLGVLSLERARSSEDLEFVRRQVTDLMTRVQTAVDAIPSNTESALIKKIGTENGQVLSPIKGLVESVSRAASDKISEIRELLTKDIDPKNSESTLSKALQGLRTLLDPKEEISIQRSLNLAVQSICAIDGVLSTALKNAIAQELTPLATQLNKLSDDIVGNKAAAKAVANTTLKGTPYEFEVVERLQPWAKHVGAEIEHVGADNKPGDITIKLTDSSDNASKLIMVLEVRDRQDPKGRQVVSQELSVKMSGRGAGAAVYVSRFRDGLAKGLGEWAEGVCDHGPWVACTEEHLITAIRFLFVQWCVTQRRSAVPVVDLAKVCAQKQRITVALGHLRNIKTTATAIHTSLDEITKHADELRRDVNDALDELETLLRASQTTSLAK